MASSLISPRSVLNERHNRNTCSSDFKKTYFLEDWWLIKAEKDIEGKRLAIAGFTNRDTHQARRLFSSAPILKIHDLFTLETTDGICVILDGFINETRTKENGFTADVFEHFVIGFPPNWEKHAEKCMADGFASNVSRSPNSEEKDNGVVGCEDSLKENEQNKSDCIDSSVDGPPKLGVDFESGVSTVDLEGTNKSSESSNPLKIPKNFLDNNIPTQPVGDMATGFTTGPSVLEENVVAPPNGATNINISTEKDKSIRTSKRKLKLKILRSGHTKEGTDDFNCNVKFTDAVNEAPDVLKNLEKENLKNKASNLPEEISSHLSPFDAELQQDPMDEITITNPDEECIKISSSGANKKKDKNSGKKASISEEASIARKNTKRVLKYETPIARRGKEKAIILSPESLTSKRSRSGRLLLPTLEFWRNQTVVYDADRHIRGIKQDLPAVEPSRGSISEPKRKRNKI